MHNYSIELIVSMPMHETRLVILEDIPEIPVTTDWNFGGGDPVIFFLPLFAR